MFAVGAARPSEHPHQAYKEALLDMGWLDLHVLVQDLNEHGDTNGTRDGGHIWHRLHKSLYIDLESPNLLPRRRYTLGVLGHFILL